MLTDAATHIVRRQLGLITRQQALTHGVSPGAIRHALSARGRWQRVLPGVYATFTGPLTDDHRAHAAVLYAGPTAMITGAEACRRHGMRYASGGGSTIVVLVAAERPRSSTSFVRVVATGRLPVPVMVDAPGSGPSTRVSPLPIVPAARAALDAARDLGLAASIEMPRDRAGRPVFIVPGVRVFHARALRDVRALLCECAQRGLAVPDELVRELEEGPRRGSGLARRAVADVASGARSAPECELIDLVATSSVLPPAAFNEPLPGYPSLRPDACWREAKLIVEIDSSEWHRYGDAPERTEQRRALLASLGWLVIPVSPRRLRAEPDEVLLEIERAYLAATAA